MDDKSNKRQRTATSKNNELHINDLSDGLLVGIASYLAKPSVALFAIAMKPNNSHPTQTSRAIISSTSWNVLDFSDVEKSLASKLSDNDIDKILRSIDAVNNLQILKLAGCVNMTGIGLDVLRTATAIKQIDLSLVGKHESPLLDPEPLLLQTEVLPILDDIISRGRVSSLKQLEFPKKWRDEQSTQMDQFIQRYNQYLKDQANKCFKCDRQWIDQTDDCYGMYSTCSGCLNHFCYDDDCRDENGDAHSRYCIICEKEYCQNCVANYRCGNCEESFCQKCTEMKVCEGEDCGEVLCIGCSQDYTCDNCNLTWCEEHFISYLCLRDGCGKLECFDCVQSKEGGDCDGCEVNFCSSDCRHHIQESRKEEGGNPCMYGMDCLLEGARPYVY